jgi:hypothetical protein
LDFLSEMLVTLQNLQSKYDDFETVMKYVQWAQDKGCEMLPDDICIPVIMGFGGCFPNIFKVICYAVAVVVNLMYKGVTLLLSNAVGILKAFVAKQEQDLFDYPEAIYTDMTAFNKWTAEALISINDVMQVQHTSMRQHLQDRHFSMERSVLVNLFVTFS